LKMLCNLPEVSAKGILLLAPTGKARVRLEEQTGQRGAGKTLAQP
jgi:ATP-dependent exoDNAse (exonuclease V) alpha subunit